MQAKWNDLRFVVAILAVIGLWCVERSGRDSPSLAQTVG